MAAYGPVRHQKNIIWTETPYNVILTSALAKTNRENKNVKYNIKW